MPSIAPRSFAAAAVVDRPTATATAMAAPARHRGAAWTSPALPPRSLQAPGGSITLFNRMLRGDLSAQEGFLRIAQTTGWPIATASGYVVAVPKSGGQAPKLAGDFNGWAPAAMNDAGDFCWAHIPTTQGPKRYKFVNDNVFSADPLARRYNYDHFGEYSLLHSPGAHLERWPQMGGGKVRLRTVHVWVPKNPPTHHLYAHDGQNLFSPSAMAGGWRLQQQVGPNTLVIGIETAANRMHDLTPWSDTINGASMGGGGADYADFVAGPLKQHIEARYGTPKKRGVMGSSLGGLAALYQAHKAPGLYDFAASLSGTVGWGQLGQKDGPRLGDMLAQRPTNRPISTKVYLDSGGNPGGGDNYDANQNLAQTLQQNGYTAEQDLWYWHEPGAAHNEAAWRARVARPLALFEQL